MTHLLLNIVLAFIWAALTESLEPANFIVGFVLGYLILLVVRPLLGTMTYTQTTLKVILLIVFFLWEIVLANLRLMVVLSTPLDKLKPRIIAVPLDARTDGEITIFANMITLTPGTLSLDVSGDRRVVYVHVITSTDAESARRELKETLERRLLAVTGHLTGSQYSKE